ncbi:prepilin-type N-terminal cleavage/methylation domain-containing protein [Candidatus Kaiserbacteria bacterium]|nr:prepilin-type N-terminal cleavage/methylation domain-containing protein [Candidatus Kaiserbacteria bacterium]
MFSHYSVSKKHRTPHTTLGGFGLIELMVSISIMVILSAIILARQDSFNSAVLLRSQAYEIALAIREVQLSAVSAASDGSGNFRSQHGVYINTAAGSNTGYRIFRDANNNSFYNTGEEYGLQGHLDPRFVIESIAMQGVSYSGNQLSIVFERPNFDARFFSSAGNELTGATAAVLTVRRVGTTGTGVGDIKTVEITSTGQIAVQ